MTQAFCFTLGIIIGLFLGWALGTANAFQEGFNAYHKLLKSITEEELETLRGSGTSHTQPGSKPTSEN